MFAKIEISGTMKLVTGTHIGASDAFTAIGAVDSPVIRDARTMEPMIPGSSLKGKLRSLLAKRYNRDPFDPPDRDNAELKSLFGFARKNEGGERKGEEKENEENGRARAGRLLFSDMFLSNGAELSELGIHCTEIKFENTINRLSAMANPRQIERVIRGTEFGLSLIYEPEQREKGSEAEDEKRILRDFELIKEGFRLLQYDYLGGHGSRGYGKVRFEGLKAETVVGELRSEIIEQCNHLLGESLL
ncbi:CRISPR-associated RAMP protein, Csm3 family [Oribacterium sp. oral taxon 078 str. F0262]|uniref:type III-A CRISPR-associated RAMP protein Csm3 n=1 Tax=Oribacterium sp. oral taxon 078 TaxID=652706 RepID=UPI0001BCB85D|nr:type III-A CRISPR-associated RAMP protein Csm3 [Oribacterium sp. oral taxon 078]EFE91099.1 CRISPR-associated RAMP protein, Csm3 family [Oribacterium sp. oral taxon 078 str. F0262]